MKEERKKYSASDFAKYHAGEMTPAEMHALEKAALDDPFLAEALEGFAYSKDAAKESSELRDRLEKRINSKDIHKPFSLMDHWWKVAALIVLIGGGALLFRMLNAPSKNSLAFNEESARKDSANLVSQLKSDTGHKNENLVLESSPSKSSEEAPALHPTTSASDATQKRKLVQQKKTIEKEQSQEQKKSLQEEVVVMNQRKINSPKPMMVQSEPTPLLRSEDSIHKPGLNGYVADSVSRLVAVKEKRDFNKEISADKSQVKKLSSASETRESLQGKVSGVSVNKNVAYPVGGLEAFEQYVKDSAHVINDAEGKRLSGKVLLTFTIDKAGKPSGISVLQSSCKPCEEEAIRLLREGPLWQGKKGSRTRVWIQL